MYCSKVRNLMKISILRFYAKAVHHNKISESYSYQKVVIAVQLIFSEIFKYISFHYLKTFFEMNIISYEKDLMIKFAICTLKKNSLKQK